MIMPTILRRLTFTLAALLVASTATVSRAAYFDLTGATLSASLELNGVTYGTRVASSFTMADAGDVTLNFNTGPSFPSIAVLITDDDSQALYSDRQVVLNIVTGITEGLTIQPGFKITINGLFASVGSGEQIGDFSFVDGYDYGLVRHALATEYNAQTGTLIITSTETIELLDSMNALVQGRLLAVPEPSTYALLFATTALGFTAWSRRKKR